MERTLFQVNYLELKIESLATSRFLRADASSSCMDP